jgi:primosomal protein N'
MKIVNVTPLTKGVFKDNLSYFSSKELEVGSIVTVPIRGKTIEALVMDTKDVGDIKTELRKSDFALKKIIAVKSNNLFQVEFIQAAQKTADFFSTSLGQVIKSFTPLAILEQPSCSKHQETETIIEKDSPARGNITKIEKFILQEPDEDRLALYKKLIREAFAQKCSIFLCAPTNADVRHLKVSLGRGIEGYVSALCSDDTSKEQIKNWKMAVNEEHPLLIIGTPLFLSLPRKDLVTIIVERENATAYKQIARPFIDARFFIERLAENKRAKIVYGDILLRSETIERSRRGEISALSPITYRSFSNAQKQILIKQKEKNPSEFGQAISPELKSLIEKSVSERWFIFSGRRGLNPLAVCGDCGHIFSCPKCKTTLILHQEKEQDKKESVNYFLCHKCGYTSKAEDKCQYCGGWKIALLGAGSEKIESELHDLFPTTKVLRLDSDTVKNNKKLEIIIADFYASPGAILVGTEMALFHLREKIENIAIISIDSYFSVPEFRISEKIFNILLRLRHLAVKNFIIQTRNPEEEVLDLALKGNSSEFHRRELSDRQKLKYPPFSTLIKISTKSSDQHLVEALETLKEDHLSSWQAIIYDSFSKQNNGQALTNLLIRLPAQEWPKKEILDLLLQLPPSFIINVDPENIF